LIACVYFTVGNVVPEPFFEDFQDQAFEESPFFFAEQQGKCPRTTWRKRGPLVIWTDTSGETSAGTLQTRENH
jgi:hypothetical protein